MKQSDLFEPDLEPDLFGDASSHSVMVADPEEIRRLLHARLAEMRAAITLPWPQSETRYHQTVFPQMARWLSSEEAAQLCFDFDVELKRLLAA